jgi:hypothetical protein
MREVFTAGVARAVASAGAAPGFAAALLAVPLPDAHAKV